MTESLLFLGHDTPQKLFRARCAEWSARPALRYKSRGLWHTVNWGEYYRRSRATGLALAALGLARGDTVTVLSENRPEWMFFDWGARCMGYVGNGIYPTSSVEQVEHILADSATRVVAVENDEQLAKVLAVRDRLPLLVRILVMNKKGLRHLHDPQVTGFDDFLSGFLSGFLAPGEAQTGGAGSDVGLGAGFDVAIDACLPQDVSFLVYTSGTTGQPKGAMISNRNMVFQVLHTDELASLGADGRTLSFLPLCHIAERVLTAFTPLWSGHTVHFPENSSTVFNDMREVQPHLVFAPPRFWEKMYSQVELFMLDAVAPARRAYRLAIADGARAADARIAGGTPGWSQDLRARLLWRFVLGHVREYLGLANVTDAITGAAPVAPDLLKWFMAIGVDLREAYGMTEASGMVSSTPPGRIRLGYAGVKAGGTELRIGAEGEILVRGANVFSGYRGMPERSAEAVDAEGWLHTGDVGELDADGYLGIRDRIKDIIITSGGKNITPSAIENLLKFSPYISDAVVIGEAKKYITCLVMIDQDNVAKYAQDRLVPYTDFASLTRAAEVTALIRAEIEDVNARLARVEQVKDFRVIAELLTAEDEELTPTMKLKRRVIAQKYAAMIESMYPD